MLSMSAAPRWKQVNDLIEQNFAVFFPIFFAVLWLTISTVLGVLSGWFRLMARYPDQHEEPILRLRYRSGRMGLGVSISGILTLSVCPSGLRIGILRIFGLFWRDFLVPWECIAINRTTALFWPVVNLRFGDPVIGTLRISAETANALARAGEGRWPERGPFPEEKRGDLFQRLLLQWAIATGLAAAFVNLAPARDGRHAPILLTVLFPATVFGVASIVRFLSAKR
jgi:hypothetical protein